VFPVPPQYASASVSQSIHVKRLDGRLRWWNADIEATDLTAMADVLRF